MLLHLFLQFLQNYGNNICEQNLALEWTPLKFLILILSLVQELQIGHERFTYFAADIRTEPELAMISVTEELSSMKACKVFEKFTRPFLYIVVTMLYEDHRSYTFFE